MNKIVESLKKLLPEEELKSVEAAVEQMLSEATEEIAQAKEAEFKAKLDEAYNELSEQLAKAEKITNQGYEEAFAVICDLNNRLAKQNEQFDLDMEEGYQEAWEMLKAEQAKNNTLTMDLYEEYEKKYNEMKEYFVEMLDKFLQNKGAEIYEQARRDVLGDPRYAEHRVALDRVVEAVGDYLGNEEVALATSSKLEEARKSNEELKAQIKMMEARFIRLSNENEKLATKVNEATRKSEKIVAESVKNERKEQAEKAKNVSGRGSVVAPEDTKVIAEHNNGTGDSKNTINENSEFLSKIGYGDKKNLLAKLAGTQKK